MSNMKFNSRILMVERLKVSFEKVETTIST